MTSQVNRIFVAAVAAAVVALAVPTACQADIFGCDPDPSLWTDDFNPDGSEVVPVVCYDPATGELTVETSGLNQTAETFTGSPIVGDDVGMISVIVPGPDPGQANIALGLEFGGDLRGTGGIGTNWTGLYFAPALSLQIVGTPIVDQYLLPIGETLLATYSTGLTKADFGPVEMGINFAAGSGGGIITGAVQIIPEPTSLVLLSTALFALMGFLRRRR